MNDPNLGARSDRPSSQPPFGGISDLHRRLGAPARGRRSTRPGRRTTETATYVDRSVAEMS